MRRWGFSINSFLKLISMQLTCLVLIKYKFILGILEGTLFAFSILGSIKYFYYYFFIDRHLALIFYYFFLYTVLVCKFRPQESQRDVLEYVG